MSRLQSRHRDEVQEIGVRPFYLSIPRDEQQRQPAEAARVGGMRRHVNSSRVFCYGLGVIEAECGRAFEGL